MHRCIYCDNDLENGKSLISLLCFEDELCGNCRKQLKLIKHHFIIGKVKGLALYDYDSIFKSLLLQYKECYDEALQDVFLYHLNTYLSIKYHGYTMVFMPSSENKIKDRGFNHLEQIFKDVKLEKVNCLHKMVDADQKYLTKKEREKISLTIDKTIHNEKILLVDDMCTTGSTLKAAIKLFPDKKLKILVLAINVPKKGQVFKNILLKYRWW